MGALAMSISESNRFQIITAYLNGKMKRSETACLLSISERSVTRIASAVRDQGLLGVKHGNCGNAPPNKVPDELRAKVLELVKTKYFDLNVSHLKETLQARHGIYVSYSTLWKWCAGKRLIKAPKVRRRNKKKVRMRMPQEGLVLQMDGSHHRWNGRDTWCLIAAIDDATSEIPYAEFFDGETTLNCMKVLKKIIEKKGVPKAIYTDQAGWVGGLKREHFTQFQRACNELGINVIFAQTPEAKGRIERAWRTMQDRLIPELRLHNIKQIKEANFYLKNEFLPNYWNEVLVREPFDKTSGYTKLDPLVDLNEILSLQFERKIGRDQTISWVGKRFEIIEKHNFDLRGYQAIVRTHLNGSTSVYVMGSKVGLRVARPGVPEGPYEERMVNASLMPFYVNQNKKNEDRLREEAIIKIYGSRETWEKFGNPDKLPPPKKWSVKNVLKKLDN